MKNFAICAMCAAFVVAGYVVPVDSAKTVESECRCDCYWRGKEDGRNEVRKANAELLKPQPNEQEWPEGTEKPWWADMPAVN